MCPSQSKKYEVKAFSLILEENKTRFLVQHELGERRFNENACS